MDPKRSPSPDCRDPADAEYGVTTETTPLLRPMPNGDSDTCSDGEQTVIVKDISFLRLTLIMSTAWVGVFLSALDTTIIATLSAPISSEFRSLSLMSWLATAYLISTAACQPISGRLTDIFGRGPGLVLSNLFFATGNLLCGLSTSQSTMIIGRVIAGIGGGGLMSIPTFLGSDLVPLRNRGMVSGIANLWYSFGAMVGSILGGFLNDYTVVGWRLAFLIQAPPAIFSAIIVLVLVKIPPKQSDRSYLARIDFFGVFLTIAFSILLVLGLDANSLHVSWIRPLPCLILSAIMFTVFIYWESRVSQPIIPVKLLLDRTVLSSCFTSLLSSMLPLTTLFYVPLYLQVLGSSASKAGVTILPSSIGISIGALGAGYIMKRNGTYVRLGVVSVLVVIVGISLFTFQSESSPSWLTSVAIFIFGIGHNSACTVIQVASIAAVEHSHQAVVASTIYLARSLGSTSGITMASALFQKTLSSRLWERFGSEPRAAEKINRLIENLSELRRLPAGWEHDVISAYMAAFQSIWILLLICAILTLVAIAFLKQHKLYSSLDRR
ncbi:hypothetical protein HIM_05903 [Hirsutella minnesotensis 3608]|uniref:Major facilitator superfamily (MFS) profile domain-containing protein n=1 Tax=Hirsutella minnesotensis 3608 TaxID=1043627 RepID=A0A0F7ZJY2_9HYPO|nr:hypothetical protein HIM_05903 [Hirsutella minnesotensis 3608]